ncbi:DUF308 domain-containing protein [Paenibacillus tarimensis]|uniref:DUF308 domain-containing protein n=1 Tax=Paenibacillus tarimensis TaxID=416012 RepID=UPI001F37591C|nr:DUF308 domain-containing protein [Paenibacillus tarimensis]MCF2942965.1 DUF308 domain-containing protein [Paenibacillus tarimensis]
MEPGWIVGTSLAVLILLAGVIGLAVSKQNRRKNRWGWWFVIFGVCAIISAFVNLSI